MLGQGRMSRRRPQWVPDTPQWQENGGERDDEVGALLGAHLCLGASRSVPHPEAGQLPPTLRAAHALAAAEGLAERHHHPSAPRGGCARATFWAARALRAR